MDFCSETNNGDRKNEVNYLSEVVFFFLHMRVSSEKTMCEGRKEYEIDKEVPSIQTDYF